MPLTVLDIKSKVSPAIAANALRWPWSLAASTPARRTKRGLRATRSTAPCASSLRAPHGFERTVMLAIDDGPAVIADRVTERQPNRWGMHRRSESGRAPEDDPLPSRRKHEAREAEKAVGACGP
jgi:hypothetical protein